MTNAELEWSLIEGLEYCRHKRRYKKNCAGCPYAGLGCAIDAAIVKLKAQEPCEDAVSRKDVINVLQSPCDMRYVNGNWHPCIGDYIEAITNLSAVAPKAQEPVKPTIDIRHGKSMWRCGSCATALQPNQIHTKFCFNCGKAVKWE